MRASSPAESTRPVATLRLGERTVAQCSDGPLAAEYALFDATDIVLEAADPVTVREKAYRTTAAEALARLARGGVTPDLAENAARSLSLEVASSFARGTAARSVISQLGAQELFDGAIFRARSSRYEGAWLDLGAMSAQLSLPRSPVLLQALHLASALAEVPPSMPLVLTTVGAAGDLRAGERTYARVDLAGVQAVLDALGRLGPQTSRSDELPSRDRRMRRALLARVRERFEQAGSSDRLRNHLRDLDAALAPRTMSLGPLAYPQMQSIERQLAAGDAHGVEERLDELQRNSGSPAGIRYLRARAALLRGEQPPRNVAELLREMEPNEEGFHKAVLDAARTWLATGEKASARHFAEQLISDTSVSDDDRSAAIEILERAAPTAPPPPDTQKLVAVADPSLTPIPGPRFTQTLVSGPVKPVAPSPSYPAHLSPPPPPPPPAPPPPLAWTPVTGPYPAASPIPPRVAVPPQAPIPPHIALPLQTPVPPYSPVPPPILQHAMGAVAGSAYLETPAGANATGPAYPSLTPPMRPAVETRPPTASGPPAADNPVPGASARPNAAAPAPRATNGSASHGEPAEVRRGGPRFRYRPEVVESLPLPQGASESMLGTQDLPTSPLQARIAMVRFARELGRNYRAWYGKTLRCDVLAVDSMQQHLMKHCFGKLSPDGAMVREILLHGALLSEIIARALEGMWTDVGPSEPGYWTMVVPPGVRSWPIGRVHRFVALGSRAKDLVGYYLDLEARVRAQG